MEPSSPRISKRTFLHRQLPVSTGSTSRRAFPFGPISPSIDEDHGVVRLTLEVERVLRNGNPRLRAPRPDMADWVEPGRVIESAGSNHNDLMKFGRLAPKPGTALAAELLTQFPTIRQRHRVCSRLPL